NPFSILNFFADHKFDSYWILSGQPAHLTALIKKRPLDFLENKLRSYVSKDLRKTGLTTLEAIPVLFHSGYLTVDTIKKEPKNPLNPKNTQQVERYYFRHPNFEVSSSYFSDCFCALLDLETEDELKTQGDLLQEAFLARDAATISGALKNFFSSLNYHQRPDNEKTFHILTQSYLLGMGFKVQSDLSGTIGRLDLSVELPDQVFLIIELKYLSKPKKTRTAKENAVLASLAYGLLPKDDILESLANLASIKLKVKEKIKILFDIAQQDLTVDKQRLLFVQAAQESLLETDMNITLASLVLEKLPPEIIENELLKLGVEIDLSPELDDLSNEGIERFLSKVAQEALRDITQKEYHGPLRLEAKEFIDLAIVIYNKGSKVKALFGQRG
ncbi:MAG: hypothetical protein LBR11_01040, partial [Deltaproteobacteria bacterium]|nr:hypothetical protein [Deltaproteobacteria bacterium]